LEFISKLEEILPAEELLFEPTQGFGPYKPFLEHAISHPAKANTLLLRFLIENFTKEGEVVLDPMAGSGSTGVVAALLGRNAIQVELEKKFFDWMEKAREKVEKHITLTPKGWIKNICGDARRLSELLSKADIILTSPPYADARKHDHRAEKTQALKKMADQLSVRSGNHHTPGRMRRIKSDYAGYSDDMENIGNLPLGNVDVVLTSPPYEKQHQGGRDSPKARHGCIKEKYPSKSNIGNLPLGNVDAVITSPPYESGFEGGSRHTGGILDREKSDAETRLNIGLGVKYSDSKDNIGNLKSKDEEYEALVKGFMSRNGKPTYLSEMFKVYANCYKVLKPGGRAIIIVKPFIRNKKVIDLPYHTWLLMAKAGFRLEKLYKLRLKSQSFWRILMYKKHPELPKIAHEWILVCRKPFNHGGGRNGASA
jgi:DNA modification methylase